jgi:hypothetical protein
MGAWLRFPALPRRPLRTAPGSNRRLFPFFILGSSRPPLRRHRRRPRGAEAWPPGTPQPTRCAFDLTRRRGRRDRYVRRPRAASPAWRPTARWSDDRRRAAHVHRLPLGPNTGTMPACPRHSTGVIGALELSPRAHRQSSPPEHTTTQGPLRPARPAAAHAGQPFRPSGACRWPRGSPTCCPPTPMPTAKRPTTARATVHSVWVVDDPGAGPPSPKAVAAQTWSVIADGHHRYEVLARLPRLSGRRPRRRTAGEAASHTSAYPGRAGGGRAERCGPSTRLVSGACPRALDLVAPPSRPLVRAPSDRAATATPRSPTPWDESTAPCCVIGPAGAAPLRPPAARRWPTSRGPRISARLDVALAELPTPTSCASAQGSTT